MNKPFKQARRLQSRTGRRTRATGVRPLTAPGLVTVPLLSCPGAQVTAAALLAITTDSADRPDRDGLGWARLLNAAGVPSSDRDLIEGFQHATRLSDSALASLSQTSEATRLDSMLLDLAALVALADATTGRGALASAIPTQRQTARTCVPVADTRTGCADHESSQAVRSFLRALASTPSRRERAAHRMTLRSGADGASSRYRDAFQA